MPFINGPPKYRRVYTKGDLKMKEGKQNAKVCFNFILYFLLKQLL